ncbi:YopX family protein [Bacillus cereus group sp. BfR-BA-01344]|uniref:YopX family protein n=1 Tax=Bacillus cereus group sp. BfR-BA-01344 TaxID=3094881 RepID=UPI0029C5137A|nr:YopX family protein [Bacillus cereus group sp. BfR-BA-01344]MDX5874774.1 YopX family protein [Bacillus cereus group sp. BfR-BA-01344]
MKEVEFRAWDLKDKRMYHNVGIVGTLIILEHEQSGYEFCELELKSYDHIDNNYVLMQYTGTKDTNGVKIFEGDMVRIFVPDDPEAKEYISTVFELEGALVVKMVGYDIYTDDYCVGWVPEDHRLEVIGNIYESKNSTK